MERKRNVSDGDSGFDSALSSRSSSISLEESHELLDFKISKVEEAPTPTSSLRNQFNHILQPTEDIHQDVSNPCLYLIKDRVSGRETLYKPPSRLSFNNTPQVEETFSSAEYNRHNPIPRSQLFNSRLELELEKQVEKMELLEVNLLMDPKQVPPPSLGIRVIGVNMIHGVPDKLNIYVKRVLEDSMAGKDGRIRVNDHIVQVNGVSLVGVSQKLAADALSSCAVNPETGVVNFVLARPPPTADDDGDKTAEAVEEMKPPPGPTSHPPLNRYSSLPSECKAPPPPVIVPAVHCGESRAFIPALKPTAPPPPNLLTMPGSVMDMISSYLSEADRMSLSEVNKSFYPASPSSATVSQNFSKPSGGTNPPLPAPSEIPPAPSENSVMALSEIPSAPSKIPPAPSENPALAPSEIPSAPSKIPPAPSEIPPAPSEDPLPSKANPSSSDCAPDLKQGGDMATADGGTTIVPPPPGMAGARLRRGGLMVSNRKLMLLATLSLVTAVNLLAFDSSACAPL